MAGYQWKGSQTVESTLRPCGTESAYSRHRRRGEPMDDECRAAHAKAERERKAARLSRSTREATPPARDAA